MERKIIKSWKNNCAIAQKNEKYFEQWNVVDKMWFYYNKKRKSETGE